MPERAPSRIPTLAGLALALPLALACVGGKAGGAREEIVLVSAASSLARAFGALESAFESTHPGADVELNLAGSSVLREQILGGAPVDVFASADEETMDRLVRAGDVAGAPRVFARNRMLIAVPAGNPAAVGGLADLGREELAIGLCAAQVPCGAYGDRVLARAGVSASVDTRELSVRALVSRIEAGELDAGIVYATDVASNAAVEGIPLPAGAQTRVAYALAVLAGAPNSAGAASFVTFVLSAEGREILMGQGFLSP